MLSSAQRKRTARQRLYLEVRDKLASYVSRGVLTPVTADNTTRSRSVSANGGRQLSAVSQHPAIPTGRAAIGSVQDFIEVECEFL